ncbi:MAG: endonuclease III [Chloroflexi bacterium]|nr:endonuclease III [Chloroflexota bacterium]
MTQPSNSVPNPTILAARRAHYRRIGDKLQTLYGYPEWRPALPPVDELVSTILSQNTSDTNRDKAFFALKAKFADWESVRDAPVEKIEETIRPAGLAKQKAPRIQEALLYITEKQGKLSLEFLKDLPVVEAKHWLTSMNGIGPKTTAIILLFAFNIPAFPVDTHVHRVTGRLGLIDEKTSADRAHDELEAIIPANEFYPAHLNFIRHGREICKARKPLCERCPLTSDCRYYQQVVESPHG